MRQSPSRTAEAVCLCRASERVAPPDLRIVDDPFAARFLSPPFTALLKLSQALRDPPLPFEPGLRGYVLARHRYIDDALLDAAGRVEQVLLLGAGYDARAWRFAHALGGAALYEVDHPATQARKTAIARAHLPPRPALTWVPVDFERQALEDPVLGAGFARGAPTFVVWEGVSMYLTRRALRDTLAALARLCGPGSRLAMDFLSFPDRHDLASTVHRTAPQLLWILGEPVSFAIHPDDVPAFVAPLGWSVRDVATRDALDARYVHGRRRLYRPGFTATLVRRQAATP